MFPSLPVPTPPPLVRLVVVPNVIPDAVNAGAEKLAKLVSVSTEATATNTSPGAKLREPEAAADRLAPWVASLPVAIAISQVVPNALAYSIINPSAPEMVPP
jgi:hypothetical protein